MLPKTRVVSFICRRFGIHINTEGFDCWCDHSLLIHSQYYNPNIWLHQIKWYFVVTTCMAQSELYGSCIIICESRNQCTSRKLTKNYRILRKLHSQVPKVLFSLKSTIENSNMCFLHVSQHFPKQVGHLRGSEAKTQL